MALSIRVSLAGIERGFGQRLRGPIPKDTGAKIVNAIRVGIGQQFDQEEEHEGDRRIPWKVSQRVRFGLGGSPRTMDDTGAYRAAAEGRGAGQRSAVRADSVTVGWDPVRFPRVRLFQGRRVIRGVAPRRVGISTETARNCGQILARDIAEGEAA